MDFSWLETAVQWVLTSPTTSSPLTFAALAALATLLIWLALAPSWSEAQKSGRLEGYLQGRDIIEDVEMERSFLRRVLIPTLRSALQLLGKATPGRDVARVQQQLVEAGRPGGLTAADIFGLQILVALAFAGLYLLIANAGGLLTSAPWTTTLRNAAIIAIVGYLVPRLWLRSAVDRRKGDIVRNFSNALDLLSVGVDAGLGLDSAMVRVCERWDNALTEEINRAVVEIRVGTPRNTALQRMADRTGVREVQTFVGVLIQSSELGVSVAHTLHTQADQVRVRRRQRAEELANQASVKMVFALVFLIFPALLVVLLGPGIPRIFNALGTLGG